MSEDRVGGDVFAERRHDRNLEQRALEDHRLAGRDRGDERGPALETIGEVAVPGRPLVARPEHGMRRLFFVVPAGAVSGATQLSREELRDRGLAAAGQALDQDQPVG